ncbi:MAG: hypothetical protein ACRD0J_04775, partial [Acidimicrobiales bacterium]
IVALLAAHPGEDWTPTMISHALNRGRGGCEAAARSLARSGLFECEEGPCRFRFQFFVAAA